MNQWTVYDLYRIWETILNQKFLYFLLNNSMTFTCSVVRCATIRSFNNFWIFIFIRYRRTCLLKTPLLPLSQFVFVIPLPFFRGYKDLWTISRRLQDQECYKYSDQYLFSGKSSFFGPIFDSVSILLDFWSILITKFLLNKNLLKKQICPKIDFLFLQPSKYRFFLNLIVQFSYENVHLN